MGSGEIPKRGTTSGFIVSSKIHVHIESSGDLSPGAKNTDALHIPIMEDASGSEVELDSAWGSETAASVNPHRSALVDHEQYDSLAIETTEDLDRTRRQH